MLLTVTPGPCTVTEPRTEMEEPCTVIPDPRIVIVEPWTVMVGVSTPTSPSRAGACARSGYLLSGLLTSSRGTTSNLVAPSSSGLGILSNTISALSRVVPVSNADIVDVEALKCLMMLCSGLRFNAKCEVEVEVCRFIYNGNRKEAVMFSLSEIINVLSQPCLFTF